MIPIDPRPELVLFDLDDTLANTSSARWFRLSTVFSRALERLAHHDRPDPAVLTAESLAENGNSTEHFADLLARHGVHDPDAAVEAQHWMHSNRFHGLSLFPGAIETLVQLRANHPDRPIGMITNGPEEFQGPKIELLGLAPYFDFIIISGVFGSHKPEPAIFEEALRLGGTRADQAVYIGDSIENDMAGARASGIEPIWMNRVGREWAVPTPQPDLTITDLFQLPPLLDGTPGNEPSAS